MKKPVCQPVSLISAFTGRRVRVAPQAVAPTPGSKACRVIALQPGAALVLAPLLIVGCWWRPDGGLTVYVNGTMPLAMRSAVEQNATHAEQWLTAAPGGIREIDLTDCREEFHLLEPSAKVLAMYPTSGETSDAQAA
ncbi:hypothetical protein Q5H92_22740 [Hymenobacter sp. M29]|uniref:Uncharacterized protein n=1 Tax=Hymenobacter mellowenesis TaxID=3063995 RepID=A0ABT9AIM7_9BACT|nr:hypothetical protein [Hymenobacter sp. M29]MDO7849199.1 hypothetical protein [Hymenobacter sp. M29]